MSGLISNCDAKCKNPDEISSAADASPSLVPLVPPQSSSADAVTVPQDQIPLTAPDHAFLIEQELARLDEIDGYHGDRDEIAEGFYRFEDELTCVVAILRTPPVDQPIAVLAAGWVCVHPLVAGRACSMAYAQHRLDRLVREADLDLTAYQRARVVDCILAGPPL
jgi:hypothetical protein